MREVLSCCSTAPHTHLDTDEDSSLRQLEPCGEHCLQKGRVDIRSEARDLHIETVLLSSSSSSSTSSPATSTITTQWSQKNLKAAGITLTRFTISQLDVERRREERRERDAKREK